MNAPFPWQELQWQRLWVAYRANRLPHALLLSSVRGSGLSQFARRFAALLLCDSPRDGGAVCNKCRSCLLSQAGNHPELVVIEPSEEGKPIRIDQIRELVEFVNLKSHYGHLKVVILDPAEAMNRNAANSLLKILEEPPLQSLLILVSHAPRLLPVTVRSRCQHIKFDPIPITVAQKWLAGQVNETLDPWVLLALADNAPLAALEMLENGIYDKRHELVDDLERLATGEADAVEVADRWSKAGVVEILNLLSKLVEDLVKLKLTETPLQVLNADLQGRLQALVARLRLLKLFRLYDRLIEYRQLLASPSNITALNLLEEFTIDWAVEASKWKGQNL